jgi:hypothetical protein
VVAGGYGNWANSVLGAIGGGSGNYTGGTGATVPGGESNSAGYAYSFAAGRRAKANAPGAFAWGDGSNFDFATTVTNEFAARATGGARFVSAIDGGGNPTAGVQLPAGGGAWSTLSDRNAKDKFQPTDGRAVLERLAAMPIQTWHYRSQPVTVRHIGPTAQDFAAAFGVGEDDRHISTVDADGVALAAIQGLHQMVKDKDAEIEALKQSVAELKEAVQAMGQKQAANAR